MNKAQREINDMIDDFLNDTEDTGEFDAVLPATAQAKSASIDSFLARAEQGESIPVWTRRVDDEVELLGDLNDVPDLVELAEMLEGQ